MADLCFHLKDKGGKEEIANRKQKMLSMSQKEKLFNIINAVKGVLTSMLFLSIREISLISCKAYNCCATHR